jgi:fluoroacetyl-CoA thioesterase
MRPGPPRGAAATLEVVASSDVPVDHPGPRVYSTSALAADAEQVCRALVRPHLEPDELAVGVRLELLHRAPVPVGETVVLQATVASVQPDALTCELMARHHGSLVARGSYEQRIVRVAAFSAEVADRARTPGPAPA